MWYNLIQLTQRSVVCPSAVGLGFSLRANSITITTEDVKTVFDNINVERLRNKNHAYKHSQSLRRRSKVMTYEHRMKIVMSYDHKYW